MEKSLQRRSFLKLGVTSLVAVAPLAKAAELCLGQGQVLDIECKPVANTLVEIWQSPLA